MRADAVNPLRIPLQVVFYQEDGDWVAHCLQFDLVGVAKTKAKAMSLLFEAVDTQISESIATGNLQNLFTPADGEYFRMFAAGEDVAEAELRVEFPQPPSSAVVIERTETRVYASETRSNRKELAPV